jgi:tetratricopeptide (TPR) repeat protein
LQSLRPVRRAAELGSLGQMRIAAIFILALCTVGGCSKPEQSFDELKSKVQESVKTGNYSTAKKQLDAMLRLRTNDFDALITRGGVAIFLGDSSSAEADFRAAGVIDKEKAAKARFFFADRATWAAREHDMKKRYQEALAIYNCLLTLYPKSGTAYHERGGVKTEMSDYRGAIDDLTKAIELDDGNNAHGDSYVLRARAKRAMGDVKGAQNDEALANAKSVKSK